MSNNGTASGVSEPTRAELPPSTVPMLLKPRDRAGALRRIRVPGMRYVKPGDAAVAEVTSLLGPPRRSH